MLPQGPLGRLFRSEAVRTLWLDASQLAKLSDGQGQGEGCPRRYCTHELLSPAVSPLVPSRREKAELYKLR
jgi:hypothetical protein